MLVQVSDLVLAQLGVGGHRPELQDLELLVPSTDPDLAEEHRPGRIELDRERSNRKERAVTERPSRCTSRRCPVSASASAPSGRDGPARGQAEVAPPRRGLSLAARSPRTASGRHRPARRARSGRGRSRAVLTCGVRRERDDHPLDVIGLRPGRADRLSRRESSARRSRLRARADARRRNPTTLTPYSGWCSSLRATCCPTWPAPTISVFWM